MEPRVQQSQIYEFIIIGAGIAGAKLFYHLSQTATCLLIEKRFEADQNNSIAKVLCMHDLPWMEEVPLGDPSIFIRDHWTSVYASRKSEVCVDGHEWGAPLAKMVNYQNLINWYIEAGVKSGGKMLWGAEALKINPKSNSLLIKMRSNSSEYLINGRMFIIASGATGYNLNSQVKCSVPDTFNTVSTTFFGTRDQILKNVPHDYIYRLHPQISTTGMLWLNRGRNFFNIGFVSEESHEEMGNKFLRILNKYEPLKNFFQNLSPQPNIMTPNAFSYGCSPRYPVEKNFAENIITIGDAAGLLYPLYFEGIVGAVVSAKIASQVLKNLYESQSGYSAQSLKQYQKQLKCSLIDSYIKMGTISDEMFFKGGEKPSFSIWEAYLQAIKEVPQVRKNIWTAYQCDDLGNYPEENDKWCGEQIYKRLPIAKKITLAPFFLKFK
ncbi:hypothetical protein NEF87_005030 [Candidatus Lokiarchaeum ossiferum]|uniref:Uncharacterized protein n=1 Tax=Candidatus Lokiarchaeum ossiferum TaxID=2951803 RepID=A0ABY6HYY7_9ARCH|nr:hypothetical protein NEF87_005030 [Candidatus Lokiarchaeum sp. B-35]